MDPLSDLAHIEVKNSTSPVELLQEWLNEAKQFGAHSNLINLATSSQSGIVGSRTVVLRNIMEDGGLVFITDSRSRKAKDIAENPNVAATFLLTYNNISRQIRIEGTAEQLPKTICQAFYDKEPLYCKIRTYFHQGQPGDWKELKAKHDRMLQEAIETKKDPEMPESEVAYKIVPSRMDFYYAHDNYIADRLKWTKTRLDKWECERIQT